jgi:hypothetical protein
MSDRDAPSDQLPEDCLPMYLTPIEDVRPLPPDLASGLLWPDSEELLQNIMAIDPSIWQQPLALAPSTLGIAEMPGGMMHNGYQDSPSNSTIADGRHAIQSLSSLISDTVRKSQPRIYLSNPRSSHESQRQQASLA